MIVCSCHGVSDRSVKACVEQGASSVEEVGQGCRAGTDCGSCHQMIAEMIAECGEGAGDACSHPRLPLFRAA